jgi:hypothetical protein
MPYARRSFRLIAVAIAGASLVGCYTYPPEPEPGYAPPPPAPRALSVTPQRKQSRSQQDRDKADCQNLASAQADSSRSWAQIFASCMGGRGYMVE